MKKQNPIVIVIIIVAFIILLNQKIPLFAVVPTEGLVAYWTFDEYDLFDEIGGREAIGMPEILWVEGINGQAIEFNGIHETNLDYDCTGCPNPPYSISLWFRANDLNKGTLIAYNHGYDAYGTSLTFNDDGYLHVGPTGDYRVGVPTSEFNTGQWYHIVATYDADPSNIQLYVDKVNKIGSTPDWWNAFGDMIGERLHYDPICVENQCGGDIECAQCQRESFPFNGAIDEVMIYNKVLTVDEINQIYESQNPPSPPPETFTLAVLPDTQAYSWNYPAVYTSQTQWIVDNKDVHNIKYVLHLGDVVEHGGQLTEWTNAANAMSILNGQVTSLVSPGNHDYDDECAASPRSASNYLSNFPDLNSYSSFSYGGQDYIIIGFEFCPSDETLAWAESIISSNANSYVIIFTHSYLDSTGKRVEAGDQWSSTTYGCCDGGGCNDGEDMWNELIKNHNNIILVLSGHMGYGGSPEAARRVDIVNGQTVHQTFQNYQYWPNGGNGYLRLYEFNPSTNTISVKSYSPFVGDYLTDSANEFILTYNDIPAAGGGGAGGGGGGGGRGGIPLHDCYYIANNICNVEVLYSWQSCNYYNTSAQCQAALESMENEKAKTPKTILYMIMVAVVFYMIFKRRK